MMVSPFALTGPVSHTVSLPTRVGIFAGAGSSGVVVDDGAMFADGLSAFGDAEHAASEKAAMMPPSRAVSGRRFNPDVMCERALPFVTMAVPGGVSPGRFRCSFECMFSLYWHNVNTGNIAGKDLLKKHFSFQISVTFRGWFL